MSKPLVFDAFRPVVSVLAVPALAFCLLAIAYCPGAYAMPFTYAYTGNTFDQISGSIYSNTDSIIGTMTFDAPTNIGLPFDDYTSLVTSFSFTDGVQTIDETSQLASAIIQFATDDQGNIEIWLAQLIVRIRQGIPVQGIVTTNLPSPDPTLSFVADFGALNVVEFGGNQFNPGEWTLRAIPEPATGLMVALGVIAALLGVRRFGRAPRVSPRLFRP